MPSNPKPPAEADLARRRCPAWCRAPAERSFLARRPIRSAVEGPGRYSRVRDSAGSTPYPRLAICGGPTLRNTIVPTTSPLAISTMVSRPSGPTSHSSSDRAACSVIVGSDGTLSLNCHRTASGFVNCSIRAGVSARVSVRSLRTPSVIPSVGSRGSARGIESPRSVAMRPEDCVVGWAVGGDGVSSQDPLESGIPRSAPPSPRRRYRRRSGSPFG